MKVSLPVRLVALHTVAVLFFMFTLYKRWFLTDIPYDCFYTPFFVVSGPVVYFFAHYLQHYSERFFSPADVMIPWNLVPGTVCIILGGLQWWFIGRVWLWFRWKRANQPVETVPPAVAQAAGQEARPS